MYVSLYTIVVFLLVLIGKEGTKRYNYKFFTWRLFILVDFKLDVDLS